MAHGGAADGRLHRDRGGARLPDPGGRCPHEAGGGVRVQLGAGETVHRPPGDSARRDAGAAAPGAHQLRCRLAAGALYRGALRRGVASFRAGHGWRALEPRQLLRTGRHRSPRRRRAAGLGGGDGGQRLPGRRRLECGIVAGGVPAWARGGYYPPPVVARGTGSGTPVRRRLRCPTESLSGSPLARA